MSRKHKNKRTFDPNSAYSKEMCNFENLYKAYKAAHRSKSNDKRVIKFDVNKLENINRIYRDLVNGNWERLFKYYNFKIVTSKERSIDALEFEGRTVQHCLCDNIIKQAMDKRLIKCNCACREYKGTLYAGNCIKEYLVSFLRTHGDGYCLKLDIKNFFQSINRQILKDLLKGLFDNDTERFIYHIIDECPGTIGLPIGNQTSQWFALYYLNPIDRIIKEKFRCKRYVRYMDDMVIIDEDKEKLKEILAYLKVYAWDKLKLEFNGKTQIIPLHKGINFLGWKYKYNKDTKEVYKRIDSSKKWYRNRSIKKIKEDYKNGVIDKKKYNERMTSIISFLERGNVHDYIRKNCKLI